MRAKREQDDTLLPKGMLEIVTWNLSSKCPSKAVKYRRENKKNEIKCLGEKNASMKSEQWGSRPKVFNVSMQLVRNVNGWIGISVQHPLSVG